MRLLVLLFPALTGCATLGTFQSAETLGQGNWEVGIEPSMWGAAAEGGSVFYPHAGVSARVGVSERIDIGGRVGSTGIELTGKFGITEPEANVPISVAPSIGGMAITAGGASLAVIAVHVPVLFGVPIGENELVVGPKLHVWSVGAGAPGSSASAGIWSVGGSVGYAARVGRSVRLIPEFALVKPLFVVGSANGSTESLGVEANGALMQIGLGIVIGRASD